jgi:hypothetical protein
MKSFEDLNKEQLQREDSFLSYLASEIENLSGFESTLTEQKEEVLFKITTELEDTESALRQAEELTARLKKHLKQLLDLKQVLCR